MGMGFQFEQHRLGLWDLSWDLKKNNFVGNGIRTPPSRPSLYHVDNVFGVAVNVMINKSSFAGRIKCIHSKSVVYVIAC